MKKRIYSLLIGMFVVQLLCAQQLDLSGKWNLRLDKQEGGVIELPGTTDEGGFGQRTSGSDFGILTRVYKYYGPAWYERKIDIPEDWQGKRVELELERVLWESQVSVDGKMMGKRDALNSPHVYDLGVLVPGEHQLTIRVSNEMIYNIGDKGHPYSEYTQTIWNGIVGKMCLRVRENVCFGSPQVYTSVKPMGLRWTDTLYYEGRKKGEVVLRYELQERNTDRVVFSQKQRQKVSPGKNPLEFRAEMPEEVKLWDDQHPNLYRLQVTVTERGELKDIWQMEVGFREISVTKSKILVNGRPVFLRGNLDCIHFPLTGYPSCKVEDWERIFRIYKDYGLNHVRFHSWCPPEAAFIAADRIGIYIQAESIWIDYWMSSPNPRKEMDTQGYPQGLGKNPSADGFIPQELGRMVEHYGNHASFVMMCVGNELGNSDFEVMDSWLAPYRAKDARRLYSVSTARRIMPGDQYMVTHYIDGAGGTRGANGASTDWDFEPVYGKADIPVIAHEIGQWPVYPSWEEIKKYTGVLRARNFEEFRTVAEENGVAGQNADFVMASGALNQIMYKYEIESFLRTPSCAGLQLLSMQDYQGQGEALVGWLDVFYDSKGIATPQDFRHHCDTTVPLLRMSKFIWENSEVFTGHIQMAHYGLQDIRDEVYWKMTDDYCRVVASGKLKAQVIRQGSSDVIGSFSTPLAGIRKAARLKVEVGLEGRPVSNSWYIWVYPGQQVVAEKDICVKDRYDEECKRMLAAGKKVLLMASGLGDETTCVPIAFKPLYWSYTFFPGQKCNTLGMLVQDKHPVFGDFPTDRHSDWQWEKVYRNACGFVLDSFPADYRPMAQPVDDFHRNHKLGALFEVKAGKGRLLVCGFDLEDSGNPVARQLKSGILKYMQSEDFEPELAVTPEVLQKMFVFREPLKSVVPEEFRNALLFVESGILRRNSGDKDWSQKDDRVESRKNTGYQVKCEGSWKDETGTAWFGRDMEVSIQCPKGILGTLYVFFHDWNQNGREGTLTFEGRPYVLGKHDGKGMWVKLHVMREDSNDGMVVLKTRASQGPNLMISKIVLMED